MQRLASLLGSIAAIMFVFASGPVRAEAASPCDPCPPDCPMMAQNHAAQAADQSGSDQGQPSAPCKSMAACAGGPAGAAALLSQAPAPAALPVTAVVLKPGTQLRAPSHPPDRSLRPPIQL